MNVLAIDVGTTAVKVGVLHDGEFGRIEEAPLALHTPQPGWAEQHPQDWWDGCVTAVRRLQPGQVDAIAVTGQMQDLIPLTGHDSCGPAVLYSDQRAAAQHQALCRQLPEWALHAGTQPDSTNVAAKWAWLGDHQPQRTAATGVVLLGAHSFVVHRLTGRAWCDPTTAATTGLFDVTTGRWWEAVVDLVGIPLPEIVGPGQGVAALLPAPAAQLGLDAGIPVLHGPGDAVATTVGIVGDAIGRPYAYLGTSGWAAATRPAHGAAGAVWLPGAAAGLWVAAAPILTVGGAADWAREALLGGASHARLDELAALQCAAAQGVCFLPHLDGVRVPQPNGDATGVLLGVRRSTDQATIAAAVVEGIAHAVRVAVATVADDAGELAVCGGLAASPVIVQSLADVCGVPVRGVDAVHAALRGVAGLAVAAHDVDATVAPARTTPVVRPRPDRVAVHRRIAPVVDALLAQLAPSFSALAAGRADPSAIMFTTTNSTTREHT